MAWLRGEVGEQGLHSLNFPSVGTFPWMQQRIDPAMLRNDLNQQYQVMLATGLQNFGSGDMLKQQLMQLQPHVQYLQNSGSQNTILQQPQLVMQQTMSPAQTQLLSENMDRTHHQQQLNNQTEEPQHHTFQDGYMIQHEQILQRQPSNIPSPSFSKPDFADTNSKFSGSISPSSMQNVLGTLSSEGSSNLLNFSRTTPTLLQDLPSQQSWVSKFSHGQVNTSSSVSLPPYPGKDTPCEQEASGLDAQNQALFSSNIDSATLLLPTTISSVGISSINAGLSSMPLGNSGFQSSLYGYMHDSPELLHGSGQDSPSPARTFVKVLI